MANFLVAGNPLIHFFGSGQVSGGPRVDPPLIKAEADDADHQEIPRIMDPVDAIELMRASIRHHRDENQIAEHPKRGLDGLAQFFEAHCPFIIEVKRQTD